VINFWCDPDLHSDSGSLFYFLQHYGDFRRFLTFSHTVTAVFFTKLSEMTDADKATNPQHLGSDAADIRIRNNREIDSNSG